MQQDSPSLRPAHPLVDFFFRTAINRMASEIASKKNATENFRLGWEK